MEKNLNKKWWIPGSVPSSKNGRRWTGKYFIASKTVVNNDTITVRIATTSDSFTLHQATISVGGVSDTFQVSTGSSGGFEP